MCKFTSILLLCIGCTNSPEVRVEVTHNKDGIPTFNVKKKARRELEFLRIWSADPDKLLWSVSLNAFPGETITYGKVPKNFRIFNGETRDALQVFPAESKDPIPLPINSAFYLEIEYHFDQLLAATLASVYYTFVTDDQGRISRIVSIERLPARKPTASD